MSGVLLAAAVGLAGAAGAVLRYAVDDAATRRRHPLLGILVVNVVGSLLLGVLVGGGIARGWSSLWSTVLGTGFCGGFTTFSTVSVASALLAQEGRPYRAALNVLGTLLLTVLAAGAGLLLVGA